MLSPQRGGIIDAHASNFNRLDRILELVTDHEKQYRDQDMRLADVVQKMSELELRMAQEWAPLWGLKERNIPMELDLARTAVETVVRQLAAVTKSNQALQAELKSSQQRQAQQQLAYESAIAVLQADIAALRSRLDDVQSASRTAGDQLRSSMRLQIEQQRAEADEQLQSLQRELSSKVSQVVHEVAGQTAASVRELESWTKQEMLQLAAKLKTVVQSCSNHQQQVNLQMEALQQQWDNSSAALEALQQEDKRIKKHVVRVQQQTEELQRSTQEAGMGVAVVQQLRDEVQQLTAVQQQHSALLESTCSTSSNLSRKVQETAQQVQQMDVQLAHQAADLSQVAESIGGCLAAAREHAAAAVAAAATPPNSYLSNLLGPAVAAAPGVGATGANKQLLWTAWDEQLAQYSGMLMRLRRRHQTGDCCNGSAQTGLCSPSRLGGSSHRQQYQPGPGSPVAAPRLLYR